ncbi:MAG: radical SAM protein, partial [Elusimicrobia bacterium]|nr:radical SAM protein [Elusimicrobiota bacterium]
MKKPRAKAIDDRSISLPAGAARRLGLSAGARLDVVLRRGRVELIPDIHSLAKVYIEPTSRCNLACRTCIQRAWDEPQGDMTPAVFNKLLSDLRHFPHLESAMLGGFGEPTAHPDLLSMIAGLKALGIRVEMVSNATLLGERLAAGLAESRLDRLWVSFDSVEAEGFEEVREGADFRAVCLNLKRLRAAGPEIRIGIAFVVTRSNIRDLARLGDLAREVGADSVSVSNVIPYSPEMEKQMVCGQALTLGTFSA